MTSSPDSRDGIRPLRMVIILGVLLGCNLVVSLAGEGLISTVHPIEVWVEGSRAIAHEMSLAG